MHLLEDIGKAVTRKCDAAINPQDFAEAVEWMSIKRELDDTSQPHREFFNLVAHRGTVRVFSDPSCPRGEFHITTGDEA